MNGVIQGFISARKRLLDFFDCPGEYPVRVMDGAQWEINGDESIKLLSCLQDGSRLDFAVARKEGAPLIYVRSGHTMVIAIDCVKTAFVLDNKRRMPKKG